MKLFAIAIMASTLMLAGCQKSVDERFEEMYRFQQKNDPEAAASTAEAFKYRSHLTDQQKLQMINAYEIVKKAHEELAKGGVK